MLPYEIYWNQVLNCNIVYLLLLHYYILPQEYPPVTASPCHPPLGKEGWRAVQSLSGDLWIDPLHTVWMGWFLMERELPYRSCFNHPVKTDVPTILTETWFVTADIFWRSFCSFCRDVVDVVPYWHVLICFVGHDVCDVPIFCCI